MLAALAVHSGYFKDMGLDLAKDGISLPGLAAKYLYSTMPESTFFSLFKAEPELYDMVGKGVR